MGRFSLKLENGDRRQVLTVSIQTDVGERSNESHGWMKSCVFFDGYDRKAMLQKYQRG